MKPHPNVYLYMVIKISKSSDPLAIPLLPIQTIITQKWLCFSEFLAFWRRKTILNDILCEWKYTQMCIYNITKDSDP